MPDLARLAAAARGILPPGVAVAAADPGTLYPLLPGETLPGAIPARLREFSAGRHAARTALAALGQPVQPIPQGDDRAPVWPVGLGGSITHTRRACLAAVTTGPGLGLDLEDDAPLPPDLWPTILLPEESLWAQAQPDPGFAARLVFSAKEAAYKAQYPISLTLFGFDTLALTLTDTIFTARFRRPVGPFAQGHTLHGRHTRAAGHILTAVTL
jgi:4'-phosphopantetheinyl transferase EntD